MRIEVLMITKNKQWKAKSLSIVFVCLLWLICASSLYASELDSALRSDPYFAQKLKMNINQDRYTQVKKNYTNKYQQPIVKTRRQLKQEKLQQLIAARPKNNKSAPTINYNSNIIWKYPVRHKVFKARVRQAGFNVKYDVKFSRMNPKWYSLIPKLRTAFGKFIPTITSGTESKFHKKGTYSHYTGYKIDIRVKDIPGVRIRHRKISAGRKIIQAYLKKLNAIPGIKAVLEEKTQYPHIDILLTK